MQTLKQLSSNLQQRYSRLRYSRQNNLYYRNCARVYDYFSQQLFHPHLYRFIDEVNALITDRMQILDIGAGTGLFDEMLLAHQPTTVLTAIEPCADMYEVLEQRLENRAFLHQGYLQDYHQNLIPQDIILFQRSLFHYPLSTTSLPRFANSLFSLIKPQGYLAIAEDFKYSDIKQTHQQYKQIIEQHQLDQAQFEEYWPLYEDMLQQFNHTIDKKQLHPVDTTALLKALQAAGFSCANNQIAENHYLILKNNNEKVLEPS